MKNNRKPSSDELRRRALLVAESFNGVLPYALEVYKLHVHLTATRAIRAYDAYLESIWQNESNEETYSILISAITNAAALSRFFWPPRISKTYFFNAAEARGRTLKSIFGVSENSSIKNRDLRNLIEHFEEKLDMYFLEKEPGIFVVSPVISHEIPPAEEYDGLFVFINPYYGFAIILGEKVEFEDTFRAIREMLSTSK